MDKIHNIYTNEIRENLKPLFANWEPNNPIKLGDYGYLNDNIFVPFGNIKDLGINYSIREEENKSRKSFHTKGGVSFKLNSKSELTTNAASLELEFTKQNAVFFNASGCYFEIISNKAEIGNEILLLLKQGKWKKDYVVVTDILNASNSLIVISSSDNAKIHFDANTDVSVIDLADAELDLSLKFQQNIGYCIENKRGLKPLMGLSKIQAKFLWMNNEFMPHQILPIEELMDNDENIKNLYFGQII